MADGLFVQGGLFHVMPEVSLKPLEKLFQAKLIAFLVKKTLLPPERARMLQSWKHSGFNVHRSRRVRPDEREDLERLARYIIRNPFSIEKMEVKQPGGPIIYRSGMNEKISLIDERAVIERILRHLGLWAQGIRVSPSTGPPAPVSGERIIEPWLDDPFPDYDTEPVMAYATS